MFFLVEERIAARKREKELRKVEELQKAEFRAQLAAADEASKSRKSSAAAPGSGKGKGRVGATLSVEILMGKGIGVGRRSGLVSGGSGGMGRMSGSIVRPVGSVVGLSGAEGSIAEDQAITPAEEGATARVIRGRMYHIAAPDDRCENCSSSGLICWVPDVGGACHRCTSAKVKCSLSRVQQRLRESGMGKSVPGSGSTRGAPRRGKATASSTGPSVIELSDDEDAGVTHGSAGKRKCRQSGPAGGTRDKKTPWLNEPIDGPIYFSNLGNAEGDTRLWGIWLNLNMVAQCKMTAAITAMSQSVQEALESLTAATRMQIRLSAANTIIQYLDVAEPNTVRALLHGTAQNAIRIGQALDLIEEVRTDGFWPETGPLVPDRGEGSGSNPVGMVFEGSDDIDAGSSRISF